jgi:transposase
MTKSLKKKIAKLYLEEGRTITSLANEYSISKSTINGWTKAFSEVGIEEEDKISPNVHEKIKKLKKLTAELEKENAFLKKAAAFFAKEIDN